MNKIDALTSYMAEIVDIMQEVHQKMQRVKEIKAEMEKLKKVETKATKVTNTTSNKITCECGCKINKSSWYTHVKTKKHEKLLNQVPKIVEVKEEENPKPKEEIKEIHDDDDENDDHDDDKNIDDTEVDKTLNKIKEMFYKGIYVYHYEEQKIS